MTYNVSSGSTTGLMKERGTDSHRRCHDNNDHLVNHLSNNGDLPTDRLCLSCVQRRARKTGVARESRTITEGTSVVRMSCCLDLTTESAADQNHTTS